MSETPMSEVQNNAGQSPEPEKDSPEAEAQEAQEVQEVQEAGVGVEAESDDESGDSESEAKQGAKSTRRKPRVVARDRADSLRLLEAALFASSEPLTAVELAPYVATGETLDKLIATLRERYEDSGLRLERVAKGWAFRTAPDLGARLKIIRERKRRISRAAAETLAVIAYNQPITRGQIEEIRGVALSGGTLDILFEAGWVAPKGRADQPGHPLLWGTTPAFLDQFSLANLSDLPAERELRASGLLDGRAALAVVSEQAAEQGEGSEGSAEGAEGESAISGEAGVVAANGLPDEDESLPAPDFAPEEPFEESFEESFAESVVKPADESESSVGFSAPSDDALDDPLDKPIDDSRDTASDKSFDDSPDTPPENPLESPLQDRKSG